MKTPTIGRKIASVLLPLTLLALLAPASAHAQTRIRLATLLPRGSSHYHILEGMGQQWRTVSGGGITLTIYPDGTMGGEEDTVRRMRVGEIQAATLSVGGLSEIDPSVGALQKIPMVYRSLEELEYVRAKMQPEMERRLEQKGFIVLFWADAGWVHIFSRKPAFRPDDFRKMKVFVGVSDQEEIGQPADGSGGFGPDSAVSGARRPIRSRRPSHAGSEVGAAGGGDGHHQKSLGENFS